MNASSVTAKTIGSSGVADIIITKEGEVSAQTLSPEDLVSVRDVLAFSKNIFLHIRFFPIN